MELDPAVEQQLAEPSDADWDALTLRVRPPVVRPGDAGRLEAQRRFAKSRRVEPRLRQLIIGTNHSFYGERLTSVVDLPTGSPGVGPPAGG
jgi:hypothetical protein